MGVHLYRSDYNVHQCQTVIRTPSCFGGYVGTNVCKWGNVLATHVQSFRDVVAYTDIGGDEHCCVEGRRNHRLQVVYDTHTGRTECSDTFNVQNIS